MLGISESVISTFSQPGNKSSLGAESLAEAAEECGEEWQFPRKLRQVFVESCIRRGAESLCPLKKKVVSLGPNLNHP